MIRNACIFQLSSTNCAGGVQQAMLGVGSVLQEYDSDQRFPVYGFGGVLAGTNAVSHCFPLTFDAGNAEVQGLQGVLAAYANSFNFVTLSGPTLFAPLLEAAVGRLRAEEAAGGGQRYSILLILTDGVIQDLANTMHVLVQVRAA